MKPFSQWSQEEVEEEFGLYADHFSVFTDSPEKEV